MSSPAPLIFWFRQDLRLTDQPALTAALAHAQQTGQRVIALYILDESKGTRPLGGASRWWLHHSLTSLMQKIPLTLRKGPAAQVLADVIKQSNASGVFWSRCYEPYAIERDKEIKASLTARGLLAESFNSSLLIEPWELKTKTGTPYQVFTPFWKAARAVIDAAPTIIKPLPAVDPAGLAPPLASEQLSDWQLLPTSPDWAKSFTPHWQPGEDGARQNLIRFLDHAIHDYKEDRNLPAGQHTSRLSPHLHFGEISPRQIWYATQTAITAGRVQPDANSDQFLAEVGWREFSYHLLYHFPTLPHAPLNAKFAAFPWLDNAKGLRAWQRGMTGYPIVDAGMRELWQTGWMHNRVRMIVASFLVKDLMVPWQQGEDWFWDTLLDADLASNVCSWQWVAGCGADAAPYFRVFNPALQGEKFDASGAYIRRYVPEIAELPDKWIHRPFEAPKDVLQAAGIKLGTTYPHPLVDHSFARDRALAAFAEIKGS